ncbi:uncharacterized protein LOC120330292 isoform X2 [Styela clava]
MHPISLLTVYNVQCRVVRKHVSQPVPWSDANVHFRCEAETKSGPIRFDLIVKYHDGKRLAIDLNSLKKYQVSPHSRPRVILISSRFSFTFEIKTLKRKKTLQVEYILQSSGKVILKQKLSQSVHDSTLSNDHASLRSRNAAPALKTSTPFDQRGIFCKLPKYEDLGFVPYISSKKRISRISPIQESSDIHVEEFVFKSRIHRKPADKNSKLYKVPSDNDKPSNKRLFQSTPKAVAELNASDESKLQKETKKQRKTSTTQKTDLTSTLSFHSSWKKKSNMVHTSGLETIQETPNLQKINKAASTIVSSTKPIGSVTKSSIDKVDDTDVELASSVNQYSGLKITSNNTKTSSIASQNEAFNGGLHLLPSDCFFRCLVELQSKRYSSVIEKRQLLGNIKNAVSKFAPQFNGIEQHDAHEFVRVALTLLKQEINDALLKGQNLGSVLHQECPITANFGFKVQHSYKCTRCSFTFAIIEDWYDIPVDIISSLASEVQSIQQLLLRSIRKEEEIENSCRSCSNGRSIKTIHIVELPRILTVYLMRYNVDRTGRVRKIHQNIGISRNLSLTKYQLNPTDANNNLLLPESVTALYELTSIVNHLGETPTSGHYISDVLRDNVSRTWQCYDDNIVTNTYGDGILQRRELDAYVLFYIRT